LFYAVRITAKVVVGGALGLASPLRSSSFPHGSDLGQWAIAKE